MKKHWVLVALLVLALGSAAYAADSHTVTVTVNAFARISVTGIASGVVAENDFDVNGNAVKDLKSTVQISVKTNKHNGCIISASAPDFSNSSSKFSVNALHVKVGAGGSFIPLANTATPLINLTGPQNNITYPVAFQLNLTGNELAGDYNTVVTYTVTPNS